ncbi:MAG: ABC transporter ATP-binding protein [Syntrophotaleaceae bacterium]
MPTLRLLWPYLQIYRSALCWGLAWLIITDLLGLLLPWMLKVGIDAVQQGNHQLLMLSAAVLAGAALVRFLTRLVSRFAFLRTACRIEVDLRRDLLVRLLQQDASFFDTHRTGDLLSRFTNDLSNIRTMAGFGLLILINTLFVYVMTLVLLMALSPSLTLLALIPFPLLLLIVKRLSARLLRASGEVQKRLGKISETIEESVAGQAVIRSYGLHEVYGTSFARDNENYLESNLVLARLRSLVGPVMAIIAPLATLLILYFGGIKVANGRMTLGELVAFNAYLMQLAMPTLMVGWVLSLAQRAAASVERLGFLLHRPGEKTTGEEIGPESAPAVAIRSLSFAYGKEPVLKNVDLEVPAGSLIGVTGPAGSGKSTLLYLLAGLYPQREGKIYIGGRELSSLDLEAHRRRLAVVFQEGRLFSGSLRENLLYAVPDGSDALARQVAATVGLEKDIAGFPEGFDTLVGEGGKTLSGGQRQRVALGRAVARGGNLWLLDDPFSHLDAGTARDVWVALRPLLRETTVFMITSRVPLLAEADRIVVLENGEVTELGRHDELAGGGGYYAGMVERERLRQELEGF